MPFVMRDFRGGTYMMGTYMNSLGLLFWNTNYRISGFNQFEFPNITPTIIYNYGSKLDAFGNLTANSQINNTSVLFIGNTSSYLIQMTDTVYSKIITKYDRYTNDISDGVCKADLYGGAKINTIKMSLAGNDIDTSRVYFPISYKFNLSFNIAEGQTAASFTSSARYKLLPGARLTVNKGVTLQLDELNIYENWTDQITTSTGLANVRYPDGKGPAIVVVNGKLSVKSLGGNVYSNTNGAQVIATSNSTCTSYETVEYSAVGIDKATTIKSTLKLGTISANDALTITVSSVTKNKTYTYNNGNWSA